MHFLKTSFHNLGFMVLALSLLLGCSGADMLSGSFPGDATVVSPDMGGPNCPIYTQDGCIHSVARACEIKMQYGNGCEDADDDCFVTNCSSSTPKWFQDALADCNDQNADISPLATERCNAVDDDCDRQVDETFTLGEPCDGCQGQGVLECAIDDAFDVACSTAPGQTDAVESMVETCNELDDDCDEVVDEFCVTPTDRSEQPTRLALCPSHILVVSERALVAIDENLMEVTLTDAPHITYVRCSTNWVVWLQPTQGPCPMIAEGPSRCSGELWAWPYEGSPARIGTEDDYGPIQLADGTAYWHKVNLNGPLVERLVLGTEGPPTTVVRQASAPTGPIIDDLIFIRQWNDGSNPQVGLQSVVDEGISRLVRNPMGIGGIPVANEQYAVWSMGNTRSGLWVVPRDNAARGGFQLPLAPGVYQPLALVDTFLFYQDQSGPDGPVYRLNISTGQTTLFLVQSVTNSLKIAPDGTRAIWLDNAWPNRYKVTSWPIPERRD